MSTPEPSQPTDAPTRAERRWANIATGCLTAILAVMILFGVRRPPTHSSESEPIDPTTLHVSGEFVEANLGAQIQHDGTVLVHMVTQQHSLNPQCLTLPRDTPVTFRTASADAVHGLYITGSDVNSMLIPGYVASFTTRFSKSGIFLMPCEGSCGTGPPGTWTRVTIVPMSEFRRISAIKSDNHCD